MDFSHEINILKQRVGDLEGAVNVLTRKVGSATPEIAELRSLAVDRFTAIDGRMDGFAKNLDTVSTTVWGLRDELPELLGTAVSNALARRDRI